MTPRILVVDDSPAILDVYDMLLTLEGYDVVLQTDPERAMADLDQVHPDLIIVDWIFGQSYLGLPMIEQLKANPATADIPVVVCTAAESDVQAVAGFLESKGVAVIYKPFMLDDLLTTITTALGSPAG